MIEDPDAQIAHHPSRHAAGGGHPSGAGKARDHHHGDGGEACGQERRAAAVDDAPVDADLGQQRRRLQRQRLDDDQRGGGDDLRPARGQRPAQRHPRLLASAVGEHDVVRLGLVGLALEQRLHAVLQLAGDAGEGEAGLGSLTLAPPWGRRRWIGPAHRSHPCHRSPSGLHLFARCLQRSPVRPAPGSRGSGARSPAGAHACPPR